MPADRPGLYVHVPFCSAICPYCDFAVARDRPENHRAYVDGLVSEMEQIRGWDAPFDTVYFGGGTPSCLEPRLLEEMLAALRRRFRLGDARVFLEANPEDIDAAAVSSWQDLGIVGVSLGAQSFDAARLRFLGRGHSPSQARRAVEDCVSAGLDWVSVDLMYGFPLDAGLEPSASVFDVEIASQLEPHHVSAYQLSVEPATVFGRRAASGELVELGETPQAEAFVAVHEALAAHGYDAYEVSNFARVPESRSRHNQKYWRGVAYLGLGPSAHSHRDGERWWNIRNWADWADRLRDGQSPVADREVLTTTQRALEELLLSLRTTGGLDLAAFRARHGVDLGVSNGERFAQWSSVGLAEVVESSVVLTRRGLALADGLAASVEIPEVHSDG
ncbi:MAG: radical SAM family heme chaperone HemW [Acidobacteriota bacterium]|nr:radical SAM family heme chaperone HemW [Acidobacteriota bacterium]